MRTHVCVLESLHSTARMHNCEYLSGVFVVVVNHECMPHVASFELRAPFYLYNV